MPINKQEWEQHRDNMYSSLQALADRRSSDTKNFTYTCRIMASIYGMSADDFAERIESGDLFDFADYLTKDEYGEYHE